MDSFAQIYKAVCFTKDICDDSEVSKWGRVNIAGRFINLAWKYICKKSLASESDCISLAPISSSEIVKQIVVFASILVFPGCCDKIPQTW